jgi:hypothetical protein
VVYSNVELLWIQRTTDDNHPSFDPKTTPTTNREAEIKHCRIAMLATVGWIVADFFKLPGTCCWLSFCADC